MIRLTALLLALVVALPACAAGLLDHHGRAFDEARLRGGWSFLAIGFSACGDVCPLVLDGLTDLRERIQAQGGVPVPRVFFLALDDSPEAVAARVGPYGAGVTGIAGDWLATSALAERYRMPHRRRDGRIEHSAQVLVLGPDGRPAATLAPPFDLDADAAGFLQLVKGSPP